MRMKVALKHGDRLWRKSSLSLPRLSRGWAFCAGCIVAVLAAGPASAEDPWSQMSVRPSLAGVNAVANRSTSVVDESSTAKLGASRLKLETDIHLEYNDNINLAEVGRLSDFIIEPHVGIDTSWNLTRTNQLSLNLGLGYQYYVAHPNLGTSILIVDPGSQLNFDVFLGGKVRLNFHDSFSVSSDPTEDATLSNVVNFSRFENTAGAGLVWDMNHLIASLDYDHYTFISLTSAFSYLNSNSETISSSLAWMRNENSTVGLNAKLTYTYFDQDVQNDSTVVGVGPYVDFSLTRYIKLHIDCGIQEGSFAGGGSNGDMSNISGWYGTAAIVHRLNRWCIESLSIGHTYQLGLISNFELVDSIHYSITPNIFKKVATTAYFFCENVDDSGDIQPEKLTRYGLGIHFGYRLNRKTSLTMDYQYLLKDSNLPLLSYYQNRVFIDLQYQF